MLLVVCLGCWLGRAVFYEENNQQDGRYTEQAGIQEETGVTGSIYHQASKPDISGKITIR